MILKNRFCRSVGLATFTPPLTKIPGSAPVGGYILPPRFSKFDVLHCIAFSGPMWTPFHARVCRQKNTYIYTKYYLICVKKKL